MHTRSSPQENASPLLRGEDAAFLSLAHSRQQLALGSAWVALFCCAVLYTWLTFTAPLATFWSIDNGAKFIQLHNLRWQDGLDLSIEYPGEVIDPDFHFAPFEPPFGHVEQGRITLQWSPLFPFLSAPFYRLWGYAGLHVLPLLAGIGSLVLVLLFARGLAWPWLPLAVLIAGLATPIALYSAEFWEHTPAVFLALLSVWVLLKWQESGWSGGPVVAALLLLLSAALRPEMLLLFPAAALALLFSPRNPSRSFRPTLLWLGCGFLAVVPAFAFFWLAAGRPLPTSASFLFHPFNYLKREGWLALPNLFAGTPDNPAVEASWFWQKAFTIAVLLAIGTYFIPRRAWAAWIVVTYAGVLLTAGMLILQTPLAPVHGFLIIAPVLIFAWAPSNGDALGATTPFLRTLGTLYFLFFTIAALVFRWQGPLGGQEWGLRYALLTYPLLAPAAVDGLRRFLLSSRGKVWKGMCIGLFTLLVALSVFQQLRGDWIFLQDRRQTQAWLDHLEQTGVEDVVTDVWWVPYHMASQFYGRRFFLVREEDLARWVAQAAQYGVDSFCLIRQAGPSGPSPGPTSTMTPPGYVVSLRQSDRSDRLVFMLMEVRPAQSVYLNAASVVQTGEDMSSPDVVTELEDGKRRKR